MGNKQALPDRATNEKQAIEGQGFLEVAYEGPVIGRSDFDGHGVILMKQPAMDPRIVKSMLDSLGPTADLQLTTENDTQPFTLQMQDPTEKSYRPFFFDRQSEYGNDHKYYESLCHTLLIESPNPQDHVIKSASARFANRRERLTIDSHLIPATAEIGAFIDALKEVNHDYFVHLEKSLVAAKMAPELAKSFVDGTLRNVAIQYHFGKASRTAQQTQHLDHINSSLHMAVTLNGRRSVAFGLPFADDGDTNYATFNMEKGDIYLTSPTAIYHGIGVPDLKEPERSVALQYRTLLNVKDGNRLNESVNTNVLFNTVLRTLHDFAGKFRIPTYDEYNKHLTIRQNLLKNSSGNKITYTNYFNTATHTQIVAEGTPEENPKPTTNPGAPY
eukprot:TRINITY_DN4411_c0_g1_i1.p1 TRINITY_DN4411_c0_g1~~TRINITY_DN4411_c0_g1_i1.p1  ORF type:complete len:387 (-),score=73.57 TRINITY_DN4411_c0_g1_i1:131-1291(-)